LHPNTLKSLLISEKDFCSSIFWTKFNGNNYYSPNCWYDKPHGFNKDDLLLFKQKGIYPVDFTGACTLLSKNITASGVRFEKIKNISYSGEDKHFCIRAKVHNYEIFIDTNYPSFHIYTESLLSEADKFINSNYNLEYLNSWLDEDWEERIGLIEVKVKQSFYSRLKNKLFS